MRATPIWAATGSGRCSTALRAKSGWEPIEDAGALIGLYDPLGGGAISLEPGGQFELSGAPLDDAHQTGAELDAHFAALAPLCADLGIGFLDLGMSPLWRRDETPVMPKQRYEIMARYMPKVGGLGLDMMFRTSTVQTNIDFASEADMVAKMRLALSLQPLFTALFANSPFTDGKPNGFLSMRSQIWTDTDSDRTGMLPFAFEPGMGFERYVDYALDVPLYFVKRGDVYHDVAGASFRDLLAGRLPQLPGEFATHFRLGQPSFDDFPRGAAQALYGDAGRRCRAARAYSRLYRALRGPVLRSRGQRRRLGSGQGSFRRGPPGRARRGPARRLGGEGRRAQPAGSRPRHLAAGARRAWRAAAASTPQGRDETHYLEVLEEIAATGETLAQKRLALYHGAWSGSVLPAFETCVY